MRQDFLVIDDAEIYGFDQAEKALDKAIAILRSPNEQFDDIRYYVTLSYNQLFDSNLPMAWGSRYGHVACYLREMSDFDSLTLVKESRRNDFCKRLILRKVTIENKPLVKEND